MSDKETNIPNEKLSDFVVNLGLFYNIFLSVSKTFFGLISHSSSLLADGINSTSDVVYYIAVKIFLRIANKPADQEHPFGHKQMENIASLVIAAFIITTAIAIAWSSIDKLLYFLNGEAIHSRTDFWTEIAFAVAIFTFISKIFLSIYTRQIYKKTKNPAISALASDHLNDVFASMAVIIGILFAMLGHHWVDPLAGVFVSCFIMKTGIEIMKEAANGLMDVSPSTEMKQMVTECAAEISGNMNVESIISHRYGVYYSLNITIGIKGNLSMNEADEISDQLEKLLLTRDEFLKFVFIHYHPFLNK